VPAAALMRAIEALREMNRMSTRSPSDTKGY
jgi:hypothetical protein